MAIVLLSFYLLSATELSQLLKIPAFVSHFNEHQAEDKDITLWEFLHIHYAQGDVKDADYEEDMKLPFKTHDIGFAQISIAVPPSFLFILNEKPIVFFNKTKKQFFTDEKVFNSYQSAIWQPPKSC